MPTAGPRCTLDLRRLHHTASDLEQLALLFRTRHRPGRRAAHHQDAERLRCHMRHDKEFRGPQAAIHHHQTMTPVLFTVHRPRAGGDLVELEWGRLGGGPVDADVDDFAKRPVQGVDELRQFVRDRARVGPPGAIDVGAQLPCEREPDGPGQSARPRHTVHEVVGVSVAGSVLSEKTGADTASVEESLFPTNSGSYGWENKSDGFTF
jgi:hypothetical protein